MTYGYSQRIVEANKNAPTGLLGVALGKVCIAKDVPVAEVAETIGVSRETIYNWFSGIHEPHPALHTAVNEYISYLKRK